MPIIKPSDEKLESLIEKEVRMEKALNSLNVFIEGSRSEFWKRTREIICRNLETIEDGLNNYLKLTPDQRISMLESRRQHKLFLEMVEGSRIEKNNIEKSLLELKKEINVYRKKLGKSK